MTEVCLVKAMIFPVVMYGCELDHKESWTPKNWCFWTVVLEKTLESPLDCKEIQPVNPKGNQPWILIGRTCWSWSSNTLATWCGQIDVPHINSWCEKLAHWKRPWCWERLKAGGEGDNRGWDGWMASLTRWTWVWGSSGSWWWTGKLGVLQSMGSQRVRHDWATELNWHPSRALYTSPGLPGRLQECFFIIPGFILWTNSNKAPEMTKSGTVEGWHGTEDRVIKWDASYKLQRVSWQP